jgi:hypothetical protein
MEAVSLTGVDPHGVDVDDETGSEELLGLGVFHRFWPQKNKKRKYSPVKICIFDVSSVLIDMF